MQQLDIFDDGRELMRVNEVAAAIAGDRLAEASEALARLQAEFPDHAGLYAAAGAWPPGADGSDRNRVLAPPAAAAAGRPARDSASPARHAARARFQDPARAAAARRRGPPARARRAAPRAARPAPGAVRVLPEDALSRSAQALRAAGGRRLRGSVASSRPAAAAPLPAGTRAAPGACADLTYPHFPCCGAAAIGAAAASGRNPVRFAKCLICNESTNCCGMRQGDISRVGTSL